MTYKIALPCVLLLPSTGLSKAYILQKYNNVWGVLHSNLLLYEADDALEAMTVINRHLITVSPFQQPRKQMRATHVWKIVSTITLWILWKYRCKRRYDSIIPLLSDILPELWGSLLAVVRGQYDNMPGSSEVVLKNRKKLLQLWRKLPLFTISSQGPIWKYHHPWSLPWPLPLYRTLFDVHSVALWRFS